MFKQLTTFHGKKKSSVIKQLMFLCIFFPAAMQANAMGLNPQLNVANMVAMQGRANTMFSQGTFTPSPTTVSLLFNAPADKSKWASTGLDKQKNSA